MRERSTFFDTKYRNVEIIYVILGNGGEHEQAREYAI